MASFSCTSIKPTNAIAMHHAITMPIRLERPALLPIMTSRLLGILLQRHPIPINSSNKWASDTLSPYPCPFGSAFHRPPLLVLWCGLLRPEQQQMLKSQKNVAAHEKATESQVTASACSPSASLMPYGSSTAFSEPTSTEKRTVLVKTAAKVKMELTMLANHVNRLPILLKMARMPRTIVASVVQKLISYAINIHLATFLYASSASLPLLPRISFSKASVFSCTCEIALSMALLSVVVLLAASVAVAFSPQTSTGSKTYSDFRSLPACRSAARLAAHSRGYYCLRGELTLVPAGDLNERKAYQGRDCERPWREDTDYAACFAHARGLFMGD
ncbi:hypothetical protein KC325_g177 [Hortaea werneckii]|nr:hypothetical protein KC325_g177 [Hortaea werneckii]